MLLQPRWARARAQLQASLAQALLGTILIPLVGKRLQISSLLTWSTSQFRWLAEAGWATIIVIQWFRPGALNIVWT